MSESTVLRLRIGCVVVWLCLALTTGAVSNTSPGQSTTDGHEVKDAGNNATGRKVNVGFIVGMVVLIVFLMAILVGLAFFTVFYGRKQRRAAKQSTSTSESENAGNDSSRRWKGESNYFVERDEEEIDTSHQPPNISPNTYSNFQTSPNGQRNNGSKDTRTRRQNNTNKRRSTEQSCVDTSETTGHILANNARVSNPSGDGDDAATKLSRNNTNSCDSFGEVSHLSGGQDETDYERHGELFLSQIAQHASDRAAAEQGSRQNTQQRHLVDSPALIQRYLAEKEGAGDARQTEHSERGEWTTSSIDRLQVQQDKNAHGLSDVHRHSRKHRARSDSVSSGGQQRRPLRELEPACMAEQAPSVSRDSPSHMGETAKTSLQRWSLNTDLTPDSSSDAGRNSADDKGTALADSAPDGQASVTQTSIGRQNDDISENADETPTRHLRATLKDNERVSRKSVLPPLAHHNHYSESSEHASRKKKRHEHHPRDEDAASNEIHRKKHRHARRGSLQGDDTMSTDQCERTDDVTRSVNDGGDEKMKERKKHREKQHPRRSEDTTDVTHSRHGPISVEQRSESAMKDLVISYKKSHREKPLIQSTGEEV